MTKNVYNDIEEIISSANLSEAERNKLMSVLMRLKNEKLNILITGPTGSGKSSTINAIFGEAVAKELGIEYIVNSGETDPQQAVSEITGGMMAQLVMECTGANPCIRGALDLVSNAGRITLTGWTKKETSLPTDVITKKEIDIRGARTSAGEFEEAIEMITSGRVDVRALLTKTVTIDEAPETIRDIEAHPGSYMKVVVRVGN